MPWEQLNTSPLYFSTPLLICENRNYLNSEKKQGFSEGKKLVIKPTVFWSWFEYYMYFWLSSLTGLNLQN